MALALCDNMEALAENMSHIWSRKKNIYKFMYFLMNDQDKNLAR